MAPYGWRKIAPVREALFDEGYRFGFFQAVHLLEILYPDRVPPGEGIEPEREVVRFSSRVGLDFPATEVDGIRPPEGEEPARMTVNVMGLAGALGPLPTSVTETLLDRLAHRDAALRDFLDLFNHRLLSLLYRARKKYRPSLDRRSPDAGRVASCLFAFLGLGIPPLRGRLEVPDRSLLPFTGLFMARSRSMRGLEVLLQETFGVAAEVVPFQGRWLDLAEEDWTRLGAGAAGRNQGLGREVVLGRRVWDQSAGFEVRLGPLDAAQLFDFLPTGDGYRALSGLVRFYVDDHLEHRLRLVCRPGAVPELRLGRAGDTRLGWSLRLKGAGAGGPAATVSTPRLGVAGGARLGWTSWLGTPGADGSEISVPLAGGLTRSGTGTTRSGTRSERSVA